MPFVTSSFLLLVVMPGATSMFLPLVWFDALPTVFALSPFAFRKASWAIMQATGRSVMRMIPSRCRGCILLKKRIVAFSRVRKREQLNFSPQQEGVTCETHVTRLLLLGWRPSLLGWRPSLLGSFCYWVGGSTWSVGDAYDACDASLSQDGFAARQAIAEQFAQAVNFEERSRFSNTQRLSSYVQMRTKGKRKKERKQASKQERKQESKKARKKERKTKEYKTVV